MSDRGPRNPNSEHGAKPGSDLVSVATGRDGARADAARSEVDTRQLDELIEDFCRAAQAASEAPLPPPHGSDAHSRPPPPSVTAMRAAHLPRRTAAMRAGDHTGWWLIAKATAVGVVVGLVAFAIIHSGVFRRPPTTETTPGAQLAAFKSLQAGDEATTVTGAAPTQTPAGKIGVLFHANPALTAVAEQTPKPQGPPPAVILPLPDFKFSTWPPDGDKPETTEEPPKRWDFRHSTTGAVNSKPRTAATNVPLPTRLPPEEREQQRGDEKPLADEKPIDPEPERNRVAPAPPAGRDRAPERRTVRRRTTRKFLLGRGAPPATKRAPKAKRTPRRKTGRKRPTSSRRPAAARNSAGQGGRELRPPVEPSPQPRPKPALVPRADARLRVSQQPASDGDDIATGILNFLRPRPQPEWAPPSVGY